MAGPDMPYWGRGGCEAVQDAEAVGAVPCHMYVDGGDEVVRKLMEKAFLEKEVSYELPEVAWKGGLPPCEPNVYSDASVEHPEIPWLAHAGFGVLFQRGCGGGRGAGHEPAVGGGAPLRRGRVLGATGLRTEGQFSSSGVASWACGTA